MLFRHACNLHECKVARDNNKQNVKRWYIALHKGRLNTTSERLWVITSTSKYSFACNAYSAARTMMSLLLVTNKKALSVQEKK